MVDDRLAEIKRVVELVKEAAVIQDVARRIADGRATTTMVAQAATLVDKAISYAREIGDENWLATSISFKADLDGVLKNGLENYRGTRPPGPEVRLVEEPIARRRIAAGHEIRRQFRCAGGQVDILDVTACELIECKARGTPGNIAEAASQLRRYAPFFDAPILSIGVPSIDADAIWLAEILQRQGFRFIEVERGLPE